jgi:CTP:molybdopterin cytidylyltransferase MocA
VAATFEIDFRARESARAVEVIAGIILAAGDSRRMGSPKALLDYQGETFVARLTRIFSKFCDPVIVVAGRDADQIRGAVMVQVVVNADPDRGQLSSLQTALARLPDTLEAFLFTPVDCPNFEESTVAALLAEFHGTAAPLVIPKYRGKRGHPVCVAGSLKREFEILAPTEETRVVVNRHGDAIRYLELDDAGVLADVDNPEAYRALTK